MIDFELAPTTAQLAAEDGAVVDTTPATEPADVDTLPDLVARTLAENVLYHVDFERSDGYNDDTVRTEKPADECNVVTSERRGFWAGSHRILLDLDIPAALIPSSTPGHSHLYLDTTCSTAALANLLVALDHAGVIERGYASASIARGHTALRIPGVRKAGT